MPSPVEKIKSKLGIADVVQEYLKLQKTGSNLKAKCPFHNEKTPSFFVSPARDSFHCFGCGKSGDIFTFVMEIEGVEFFDALKILAGKAGVELTPVSRSYETERSRLSALMEEAEVFYQKELKKNREVGAYLKQRGMNGETALSFRIGFAPDDWRKLYDHLTAKGYKNAEMEKAGVIVKGQSNYYDRFRGRIMFPINDASGHLVGFSGRIFGEETPERGGKYVNTPQTILYNKSKILYGFDKAKKEIRKKDTCVLVEGQMDVIMSHQAGVANAVAVSGTALTAEHLFLIKRLTDNLIIAFDKDTAGAGATERGVDMALAEGFNVKVAVVTSGKDPADAIKENPSQWAETVEKAEDIIEFYFKNARSRKEITDKVLPRVAVLPSEMEKASWARKIADKIDIREEAVWSDLGKIKNKPIVERGQANENKDKTENGKRLAILRDRITGFILWQSKSNDASLSAVVAEAENELTKEKIIENINELPEEIKTKLIFEAEAFCSAESMNLGEELKKLVGETKREKLKEDLLELGEKIKKLEDAGEKKGLENEMEKFYQLAKHLNEKI